MTDHELQARFDAIDQRIAELSRRVEAGEPRLGPRPPTDEEITRQSDAMVEGVKKALEDVPPVDRSNLCTTNGKPVEEVRASQTNETGQHDGYIVLCDAERAKGFVRPYRDQYQHVGVRPTYPTRELTAEEHALYDGHCYVVFEAYPVDAPESHNGTKTGRYWTQAQLNSGCRAITTMGLKLSETYAHDPKFYGETFCVQCNVHLPVAEFVWTADGQRVGS